MEYMSLSEEHKTQGHFGFQGTPFCASINSLDGSTMSRRDDIESLAYSIMQLVDMTLMPWNGKEEISEISRIKKEFEKNSGDEDIHSENHSQNLEVIRRIKNSLLVYSRSLKFAETPDYDKMV